MDKFGKSYRAVAYLNENLAQIIETNRAQTGESLSSYIENVLESALMTEKEVV